MSPAECTHHFLNCLGLEIHYTAWGDPAAPVVVCWHGLTRTGRDFDELAQALSERYYVLCPDTPGRGWSQWSRKPEQEYTVPFYAQLALNWLAQLGIESCHWVGTSMGGLIGMAVAAVAPERIQAMLLNDVGPEVPQAAVERIRSYVAKQPVFDTLSELETWMRQVYLAFGESPDAFWRRMALTSARRLPDGRVTLHYDPALVLPFEHINGETLWNVWPQLACPLRVIRGELSDVLLAEHLERMLAENTSASAVVLPDIGHAPSLASPSQIALVIRFLETCNAADHTGARVDLDEF